MLWLQVQLQIDLSFKRSGIPISSLQWRSEKYELRGLAALPLLFSPLLPFYLSPSLSFFCAFSFSFSPFSSPFPPVKSRTFLIPARRFGGVLWPSWVWVWGAGAAPAEIEFCAVIALIRIWNLVATVLIMFLSIWYLFVTIFWDWGPRPLGFLCLCHCIMTLTF